MQRRSRRGDRERDSGGGGGEGKSGRDIISVSIQAVSTSTRLAHSKSLDSQDDAQATSSSVKGLVHVATSSESLSAPES